MPKDSLASPSGARLSRALVSKNGRSGRLGATANAGFSPFEGANWQRNPSATKALEQSVDIRRLAGQDFLPGFVRGEPLRAIDLGKGLHLPAVRRPFQLEHDST